MKIIDEKENTTLFKNVDIGEVFKMNDDSSTYTYMKIIFWWIILPSLGHNRNGFYFRI